MSDLTLDQTNDGHKGTEIQAQDGFSEHYVFQANATHISNTDQRYVDGLHGFGYGDGRGIVGVGGSQPNSPIDDLDSSSTELNAQGQGVLGVGGDERPGWTAGEGVRGIGGRGTSRTRGASGVYGKGGGVYGGHGVLGVAGGVEGSASGVLGFAERDDRDEEATCGRGGTFVAGHPVVAGHPDVGAGDVTEVNRHLEHSGDDVITSEGIAQIRLVPSRDLWPPGVGRIGDLFACSENGTNVGLYLCVVSSLGDDTSPSRRAQWAPIQLSSSWVTGA